MNISTAPPGIASRHRFLRWKPAAYWLATATVVGELGLGGIWDITRLPSVRELVTNLGYPSYFLVLLGTWKVLGAGALLVPRRALLKEWAYAGAFFTYSGAVVSHLTTGYDLGEVPLAVTMAALTVLSWALRPASRRAPRPASAAPPGSGPRHPGHRARHFAAREAVSDYGPDHLLAARWPARKSNTSAAVTSTGPLPTTVKNDFRSNATARSVFGRHRPATNSRYRSASRSPSE
jgi:DoxX-like family